MMADKITAAGFTLETDGQKLIVKPSGCLTDEQRQFIRKHKAAIIAELQSANDHYDPLETVTAWLDKIGETDPDIRRETLDKASNDPAALACYLRCAKEHGIEGHQQPETIAEAVALVRKGFTVKFHSRVIDTDLWLVANDFAAERLKRQQWYDGIPVYTEAEILRCKGFTPDEAKELHEMKKAFGGRIVRP